MNKQKPARNAGTEPSLNNWLTLKHAPGIGASAFHTLISAFGSVGAVLDAKPGELRKLAIKEQAIDALCNPDSNPNQGKIKADLRWLEQADHHLITLSDARYPASLKELNDAPLLLYVRGDPDYLQQPQLAMVGSRNATAAGRNTAKEFAHHLSDVGITITSGLASGIDGASHEGALQGLAGTIAVVAHGLDIVYPAQHQQLAQQISEHGAIVSEMPIGTQLQRGLFPRRNRLISALSLGTLVVEAAQKSGSLITARLALEQNREVFAIPGSIHNPMARGCHQLIRQGAKLVESASDILEDLPLVSRQNIAYPIKKGENTPEKSKDTLKTLDRDHQKLLKCLAYEPTSIDELVVSSRFSAAEVASMLLILELEGVIASQDGRFTRVI
jgi:DNA processing protein